MHWAHWLVVMLSLVLTATAWYFSKKQHEEKITERFQREVDQVVELVKERMALYENALWGGVALFDASEEVTYPEWKTYAQSLHIEMKYPGISGIGVIFNLQPDGLEAYFDRQRQWRPDYRIHPPHQESEYWPITYIEPVETNGKAVGLDMAFETNRYTAIRKARDSGQAQVTGPIVLVQDSKKTPGFLFYTPFYKDGHKPETVDGRRENIVGVTYAPFIMAQLMRGTLAHANRHVGLRIRDDQELLFDDHVNNPSLKMDPNPQFEKTLAVDMYGRTWTFDVWSTKTFQAAASSSQPYLILFGGITIDGLLFSLFVLLTRANRRALSYADQVTQELRVKTQRLEESNQDLDQQVTQRAQAEERFRATIEASPTAMVMVDRQGCVTLVNNHAESLFGYRRDELLGQPVERLIPQRVQTQHETYRQDYFTQPEARPMGHLRDLFGLHKDGTEFPVEVALNPLVTPEGVQVLAAVNDITERKRQEQLLRLNMEEITHINEELEQFAYVASHDLRSPLEGIKKLADWVHKDNSQYLPDKSRRHLEQMQQRVGRMENLLESLLQYSRAGRRGWSGDDRRQRSTHTRAR